MERLQPSSFIRRAHIMVEVSRCRMLQCSFVSPVGPEVHNFSVGLYSGPAKRSLRTMPHTIARSGV